MGYLDFDEWQQIRNNLLDRFWEYQLEMWGMWPSQYPIRMSEEDWEKKFKEWKENGCPPPLQ